MTPARRALAARYLRLLASAENLAVLHMDDEVRRAFDAVDPIEARELANELEDERDLRLVVEDIDEHGITLVAEPREFSVRV